MRFLLFLCTLTLATAGCLASSTDGGDVEPADGTTTVTRPDDADALANASAPGWHVHDYWGGTDRFTAAHDEVNIGKWVCTCDSIDIRFRGDPGMLVPLGTARVDVTVEWEASEEGLHGTPELWVKAANASEPARVAVLENGATVTVEATNEEADPPHQILSRWEYWVVLPAVDREASFAGTMRVHAEAVRGLPIPAFPPHPDLWNGAAEIPLFDATVPLAVQHDTPAERSRTCRLDCLHTHEPADGVIVPYDATAVLATLTFQPGMPAGLGLRVHGGDTWERVPVPGERELPNSMTFRIPVTPKTGDSPYAKQSLWEFEVFIDEPTPERVFVGGYRLTATVVKE